MGINLGVPQLAYLLISAANLVVSAFLHGRPQGEHNAWATLTGLAISLSLLAWGGFFS